MTAMASPENSTNEPSDESDQAAGPSGSVDDVNGLAAAVDLISLENEPKEPSPVSTGLSLWEERKGRELAKQRELADAIAGKANLDQIRILLASGAAVNAPVVQGLRPLHYAVYANYLAAVNLLLLRGAEINVTDDVGYTAIHLSAEHGSVPITEALILAGAQMSFIQQNPADPRDIGIEDPLRLALKKGHAACAGLLLRHGAPANTRYFLGAELCLLPPTEPDLIRLLLEAGADANVYDRDGLTPLMRACRATGGREAVRLLLSHGAFVNAMGLQRQDLRTPLHFAVLAGNEAVVALLIREGASVNMPRDYEKASPLDLAVLKDSEGLVQTLLYAGADPCAVHTYIGSPLHLACCSVLEHQDSILRLLLDGGADPNLCPAFLEGRLKSPMVEYIRSTEEPKADIIRLLLAYGGRVVMESPMLNPMGMLRNLLRVPDDALFRLLLDAAEAWNVTSAERLNLPLRRRLLVHRVATQPRSLVDMARLVVREHTHGFCPSVVGDLEIPVTLKRYLLFGYRRPLLSRVPIQPLPELSEE